MAGIYHLDGRFAPTKLSRENHWRKYTTSWYISAKTRARNHMLLYNLIWHYRQCSPRQVRFAQNFHYHAACRPCFALKFCYWRRASIICWRSMFYCYESSVAYFCSIRYLLISIAIGGSANCIHQTYIYYEHDNRLLCLHIESCCLHRLNCRFSVHCLSLETVF